MGPADKKVERSERKRPPRWPPAGFGWSRNARARPRAQGGFAADRLNSFFLQNAQELTCVSKALTDFVED